MLCRPDLRERVIQLSDESARLESLSLAIRKYLNGEIFLKMSRASNNRCRFCNDAPQQDGTFWPYESLIQTIDEGSEGGVRRVFLSGGEPTIHPQFVEVVAYAKSKGADRIVATTNGRMFAYKAFARKAVDAGLNDAFVALLGSDAETHDWHTQVPGSFEQTVTGIRNLLATGRCRVALSTVVTRRNMHQLSEMLTLIPGIGGMTAGRVAPFGRALFESMDEVGFEVEEARPHVEAALAVAKQKGIPLQPKMFPVSFYEGHQELYVHHEEYFPEVLDTEKRLRFFSSYSLHGEDIMCRGETCRVCYRSPFCDALYAFREGLLAGTHPWVRCDLDDEKQRSLLPEVLGDRRLWVTLRRASELEGVLAGLGVTTRPGIVECESLEGAGVPACDTLILPENAEVPSGFVPPADMSVGLRVIAGASPSPDLRAVARFAFVPTYERERDQRSRGAVPEEAASRGLPVVGLPPCVAPAQHRLPAPEEILDLVALAGPTQVEVEGFTHHFLRSLHRTKTPRCGQCAQDANCRGAHVNQVQHWGLERLRPAEG